MKFRPTNPRVLPSQRNTLIVTAETDIGAVTIAYFDGLVFPQWKRKGCANARICLAGDGIGNAVEAGGAAEPQITVKRSPTVLFVEVVTQVTLKGADGAFRLRAGVGYRVESVVCRIEPYSAIGVQEPMAPTPRITSLGFEGPSIDAPVDEVSRI